MKIYTNDEIKQAIDIPFLMEQMEHGLRLASQGHAITAPTSFMHFDAPKADVHIKSGAFRNGEMYVVKLASGFYHNPSLGLPSSNGVMLLFSQKTGELIAILLDEGQLTDLRTGLAGAIAAKYLAPSQVNQIGIVGTGTQARQQLFHLQNATSCKKALVWGRDRLKANAFASDPFLEAFHITVAESIEEITEKCNLIVTTTPSTKPLLFGHQIRPGTHITAVGADGKEKQELDESVFDCADLIVVDSLHQCSQYGDLSHAKNIDLSSIIELGKLVNDPIRRKPSWITVADLTGIATMDLQVAKAVYQILNE